MRRLPLALALLLAGCTVGPDYHRPVTFVPARFKELAGWKPATPADMQDRGAWWSVYRDPVLDRLERRVAISNQSLKAAEAAYRQAQAIVQETRATLFPTLGLSPSVTRQGFGSGVTGSSAAYGGLGGRTRNTYGLTANAAWEVDVWGRIRRTVESNVALAQASAADIAAARLSAQATLATAYFQLRTADAVRALLDRTIADYSRSLKIAQNQYAAGVAARSDVVTAEAQLQTVQAQAIAVGVQRAQNEHAIAVLAGMAPADLAIAPAKLAVAVPVVPPSVPSTLLERRPDIAAAERVMAQQNALIGVQIAAFYPTVSLSADYGFQGVALGGLISAAHRVWSLGAAASQTLFAGGQRRAAVEAARAGYDQAVASYRQTVLTGFQQVEDALASLRILAQQAAAEAEAVRSAQQAVRIALNEYRAGTAAYTAVITAQATELSNEETALSVQQNRLTASVALIQALGGGWAASDLPSADALQRRLPFL